MAETSTIFGFMKYVSATDILSDFKKTVDSHFVNSLKAVPNSLFDLTNDFVPYTRKFKSGFEENPTWRIIELHGTEWMLFMSFNFIKFIEDSIYRSDELEFKLKENSKLLIKGAKE